MQKVANIYQYLKEKSKFYALFISLFLLSACHDSCPTMQEGNDNCDLCAFYQQLAGISGPLANAAWSRLAPSLALVIPVIAAIYVAVYVLKSVGSFGKITVADFLTGDRGGLIPIMFKATIIYLLLTDTHLFFQAKILFPILQAGMEIGNKVSLSDITVGIEGTPGGVLTALLPAGTPPTSGDWTFIFHAVGKQAEEFNKAIHFITGIGQALICDATIDMIWKWKFAQMFYGFILFIFGWILMAEVTLFLIDLMVRLTFAAVLLAPGIAFAFAGLTKPFAKNIWNLFINVFFSFIMLGIVMGMVVSIVLFTLGFSYLPNAGTSQADFQGYIDANDIDSYAQAMVSFGQLLLSVVCFSLMVNVVGGVGKLVDDIADTAGFSGAISPSSQAAAPFAQSGIKNAKKVGGWATNTSWNAVKYTGHVGARITHLDVGYNKLAKKIQSARGYLTGTGAQGYKAWWRK